MNTIPTYPVPGYDIVHQTANGDDTTVMRFSSLTELNGFIQGHKTIAINGSTAMEKDRTGNQKFHQHSAFDSFRWLAHAGEGFPYTPDKTPINLPLVTTVTESTTYTRQYGLRGVSPSTGRFLGGNPRCMAQNVATQTPRKAIKIIVGVSASANVTPAQFDTQAQALMRVIEHYGALGYPLQIDAVWKLSLGSIHSGIDFTCTTTIKPMSARYSAIAIAFAMANRDYLRRIMFRVIEIASGWSKACKKDIGKSGGYGWPKILKQKDYPGTVVLKTYAEPGLSQQQAIDVIVNEIKKVIQ